jgi:group II intron reverse transcriptase/maturase
MKHGYGKSDSSVVPEKSPNKTGKTVAEAMEERELAKGNPPESNTPRTQSRISVPSALERIRQAAVKDKKLRFSALFHHVYDIERLREAYFAVKHNAAPGIDGETWKHYGENLETNLLNLSERLRRGAYRVKPVRRAYIPKADGKQRPIGLPALEDKIVQRAVVEVLNAIYERDFLGFSYGFRPGRQQHHALDALSVGILARKVSWILDADIRAFFDSLGHEWLVKFLAHRIADRRIVRLIQKWLKAGVLEEGRRVPSEVGAVQGGSISPLLANIYLHYVFDLWVHRWRTKQARGDVIVIRFADDFIVGFQYQEEARRFLADLKERLAQFGLDLHPDKTRLIEFGRFAQQNRHTRGQGKPETFNFLGFTHICSRNSNGRFLILRKTARKKWQAKLKAVRMELRRRLHDPVPEQGSYLRSVVLGHIHYYGVPTNSASIRAFRYAICRMWFRTLRRRSDKTLLNWSRMQRLIAKWIPPARICHPYPSQRLVVKT